MNPYLEASWRDVHARLIVYACDQLQPELPRDLRARTEERVFVTTAGGHPEVRYPDVRVVELARPVGARGAARGGVATAEPLLLALDAEPFTETFVEIRDARSGGRVVTVLEFLSPTNKEAGPGRTAYLEKRRDLRQGGVNLVEVDLLRAGARIPWSGAQAPPPEARSPYQVLVYRSARPAHLEWFALPLRARLPVIRVPLRAQDDDVLLDLQALVERVYRNGGYDDIDYRQEPEPPLELEDAAWVDRLLRGQGLR
jgi:hypothetical protein